MCEVVACTVQLRIDIEWLKKVFYLHLVLWNLKAKGFVVVWIQRVLLHGGLLLLQPLPVL